MRLTLKNWKRARIYAAIGGIGLGALACVTPPLETPVTTNVGTGIQYVPQNLKNKVDILVVVDNSNSMDAMQGELKNKFSTFFKPFDDLAAMGTYADLHIGVVTSDYGAGATGAPGCSPSPGGQQGRLQSLGAKAATSCLRPTGGKNFIEYQYGMGGPVTNLPTNQNLNETFICMASVGASGCGFEHQLESVYAALHNNLPDNQGFLRDDALLAVVFLTNEDDASAPPDSDVFDRNKAAQYGYEDSYSRQTRFAVMCCPSGIASCDPSQLTFPPYEDSQGPLAQCQAAPNIPQGQGPGKQYDISRYIDLFTKVPLQGGIKTNPLDVILVGIDAPEEPFQVILSNPGTASGVPYQACSPLNESSNPPCVPVLQHSCQNNVQKEFFGDPSVRLNTVIRSSKFNTISSICGADLNAAPDYTQALEDTAKKIVSALGGGCIQASFPPSDKGTSCAQASDCGEGEACNTAGACVKVNCTVEDLTANPDGTTTVTSIPQCEGNGGSNGTDACWRIELKNDCSPGKPGASPDGLGLTIDRAGQPAPDHTTAQVSCAVM
jgi:hypothetical protein